MRLVVDRTGQCAGRGGHRVQPGAVLDTWSSRPDKFAEIPTEFIGVACEGAPDVTVVAGPHQDASGVLQLMRNLGHQIFLVAADAPPPVVEVRLTGGGVIAGLSA